MSKKIKLNTPITASEKEANKYQEFLKTLKVGEHKLLPNSEQKNIANYRYHANALQIQISVRNMFGASYICRTL